LLRLMRIFPLATPDLANTHAATRQCLLTVTRK
jgi:hypothetical protein